MKAASFASGTEIWIRGRAARIVLAADPRAAKVELWPHGERTEVDLLALHAADALRWEAPADHSRPPLALVSEKAWGEARRREEIIRPLLDERATHQMFLAHAAAVAVSWRTLYRWVRAYREDGTRGLAPNFESRGGAGKTRLGPQAEEILARVIREEFLRRERPSFRNTLEQLRLACADAEVPMPDAKTLRRRIAALRPSDCTRSREGGSKSRDKHMVSRGAFPDASHPLQTILVDHTLLNVHLVDADDRSRVIGRPTLTLAIDAHTRMIYGYFISLDPASYLSVAMCLLQGALDKGEVLRRYGLGSDWPIHGLPMSVHTDNGKDFRSKHLDQFAAQYRIELVRRPVRVPHYGGIIERAIKTINDFTHNLPGTAKANIEARGDYPAEARACLTIEEVERFIAGRIVDVYHRDIHSGIGKSPLQAWKDATGPGRFMPAEVSDVGRFRIDLLPYEERTVQKAGIELFGLTYTDGALAGLRSQKTRDRAPQRYVVKYDPRDLSKVWVLHPEGDAIQVPLSTRAAGPFSLLELRRSRDLAKASGEQWRQRDLPDHLRRERSLLEEAAEKTKRDKRAAARRKQQRKALGAQVEERPPQSDALQERGSLPIDPLPAPGPIEMLNTEAADDDWGPTIFEGFGQ